MGGLAGGETFFGDMRKVLLQGRVDRAEVACPAIGGGEGTCGHEVIDAGAENGSILGAHIENHDGLAFGQVVVTQTCDQTADGEAIIGDGILAERVGRSTQIFTVG